jgi:hypothetical protein
VALINSLTDDPDEATDPDEAAMLRTEFFSVYAGAWEDPFKTVRTIYGKTVPAVPERRSGAESRRTIRHPYWQGPAPAVAATPAPAVPNSVTQMRAIRDAMGLLPATP